jgi:hypothetical protein
VPWITLHTLTGKGEPFNTDHMVRVFEFEGQTNVATADGKVTGVLETMPEMTRLLYERPDEK